MAAVLALAGCGAPPPPPPPPTVVNLKISASATANAGIDGQGAPVAIRIYQLSSKAAFDAAEFYRLYNADAATLGSDLVKKDEYLVAPGGGKEASLAPVDAVKAIGVFAAYRDFQNVIWRASVEVPAHKTTTLTIAADKAGIKVVAVTDKPPAP